MALAIDPLEPGCGREVDDGPALAFPHALLDDLAAAEHGCGHIDGDGGIPVFERLFPDVQVLAGLRRVVAHDVDPPVLGHSVGHHGDDRRFVRDVGGAGDRPASLGPDRSGHLFEELGAAPGQRQVGALVGEQMGHHLAQSITGSGDDDDLVCQSPHVSPPCRLPVAARRRGARYPSIDPKFAALCAWHALTARDGAPDHTPSSKGE